MNDCPKRNTEAIDNGLGTFLEQTERQKEWEWRRVAAEAGENEIARDPRILEGKEDRFYPRHDGKPLEDFR